MDNLTQEEINSLQELAELVVSLKEINPEIFKKNEKEELLEDLIVDISADLYGLRYKHNLTVKDVARKANLPEGIVYDIESLNGYGNDPSVQTLFKLFYALGHCLYISPFGEYSYTIPEEYRELVNKKAAESNLSTKEWVEDFFENHLKKI